MRLTAFSSSGNRASAFRNVGTRHRPPRVHPTHRPLTCRILPQLIRNLPSLSATAERVEGNLVAPGNHLEQISTVYKFGGSSVSTPERMLEVADIICSFPDAYPCIVLSAMGKTTNLLLESGALALQCSPEEIESLEPVRWICQHHIESVETLGADTATREAVHTLLAELKQLLTGISMLQECSARARDNLVSFGERLSTRIFAGLLRAKGVPARQYDAWEIGFVSSDEFGNADLVYEETLRKIRETLIRGQNQPHEIPIVTGFLAKGEKTGAITTLGRGGSDLSATVIGAALGVAEAQVWKDVDGVLTCDPRIVPSAQSVPLLTFEEAAELAHFGAQVLHPQAMKPAQLRGNMAVRVKNSYNRTAPGTLIQSERDLNESLLSSLVVKRHVTMVDIVSTKMVGQYGFLAKVFDICREYEISVDVVATSEVSISLTLDVDSLWTDEEVDQKLVSLRSAFKEWADVSFRHNLAILSLICNVGRSSEILVKVFKALGQEGINVQMMSQGASKTNISLIVDEKEALDAVKSIHDQFF
ncbi:hypothetical protein BSKO_00061 [Bryopsis sp. KO-2023]|nr:hypothetical protein BSKO_00061 [Bryopsis sp. KO-2023]